MCRSAGAGSWTGSRSSGCSGIGVEEQRQPPHPLLTLIPTISRSGRGVGEELVEGVAAVQVLLRRRRRARARRGCAASCRPGRGRGVWSSCSVQPVAMGWSRPAATAGCRCGWIRHQIAAAPCSSGSGPCRVGGVEEVAGVDAGAVDGGEPSGEDGQEPILRRRRAGSRGWPVPIPARRGCGRRRAPRRECVGRPAAVRASWAGPVGRRSVGVDAGGGPPHRDLFDELPVGAGCRAGARSGVSGVAAWTWAVRLLIRSARPRRYGPQSGWSSEAAGEWRAATAAARAGRCRAGDGRGRRPGRARSRSPAPRPRPGVPGWGHGRRRAGAAGGRAASARPARR